jgi:ATP-dependent RNA helicase SUPV3L1/SUV3
VRTWAYVANRSDWLVDHEHWRGRARDIEDRLSDALHAALAQRFVDRRTSALLKGLKRDDAMLAGVSSEGEVTVEGHYVGRLVGLEFQPDPRAGGLEGRALRHAALRALAPEVARRLSRIARGEAEGLEVDRGGRVCVAGAPAARLIAGPSLLKPRLELIGAEAASPAERGAALERLELWLAQTIAAELAPLIALESAWREARVSGAARGVAFRLIEQSGALDCAELGAGELTEDARADLRALGVRVGRHSVFLPALIKPKPARLLALLSRCARGGHEADLFLPRPGALSAEIERPLAWAEAAAAGYRPLGRVAVRFDRVEVLAAALARSESPAAEAELARLVGRPARELGDVLGALGYRRLPAAEGEDGAAPRWRAPKPARKTAPRGPAKGPFAVLAGLGDGETPRPRRKRGRV